MSTKISIAGIGIERSSLKVRREENPLKERKTKRNIIFLVVCGIPMSLCSVHGLSEFQIITDPHGQGFPAIYGAIYGDIVVWEDDRKFARMWAYR